MECGECTLCCELLYIKAFKKPAGKLCTFCENKKCTIWNDKPEECTGFECAYLYSEKANIKFRPDYCGIIFEKLSDRLFLGTYSSKRKYTKSGLDQVINFLKQGFSVILNNIDDRKIKFFISSVHKAEDIKKEFLDLLKKRSKTWQHTEQI